MNRSFRLLLAAAALLAPRAALASPAGVITIPGDATDLSTSGVGISHNRLGGFGSDLFYHRATDSYYGLADRGASPSDSYHLRVQKFSLDVDHGTGGLSNFQLDETIFFKTADGSQHFDGMSPANLNGTGTTLGLSFDPEGFAIAPSGNFYLADEYGPSIYEFQPVTVAGGGTEARFVRSFSTPSIILGRDAAGVTYDTLGSTTMPLLTGRQENRGFEGLAVTPAGDKLYGILQSPLQEEGSGNNGRRSRNIRLVEFDTATGASTAQYAYQVEAIADLNARVADDCLAPAAPNCADFTATQQGRNIVVSGIVALSDHQFLVIERDNRGIGNENPSNQDVVRSHVASKRVYMIDIEGATDISGISLAGTNNLPVGAVPVGKELYLDIQAHLEEAGLPIPEKIEGIVVGPVLASGQRAIIAITENDFTSIGFGTPDNEQMLDIYTSGPVTRYTPADDPSRSYANVGPEDPTTNPNLGPLPAGFEKLPTYIYSFPAQVPEPSSLSLAVVAGVVMAARRASGKRGSRTNV